MEQRFSSTLSALAKNRLAQIAGMVLVFSVLSGSLIIFRNPTLAQGAEYFLRVFDVNGFHPNTLQNRIPLLKALTVTCGFFLIEASIGYNWLTTLYQRTPTLKAGMSAALIWIIAFLGTFKGTAFVYFQF